MRDIVFRTIMLKGASGNDIVSIEKTSTSGAVDTYTITLSDGSTETFNVTNGTSIASIEKTSTSGLIDTYTITLTDGSTSTFEVANGENAQVYEIPKDSVIGFDSEDATPAGYDEISSPYDAALSATSDNAPQNKAVKAALDLKANVADMPDLISTANTGSAFTDTPSSAIASGSSFNKLGSLAFTKGVYLLVCGVQWQANSSGYRKICISTSSGGSSMGAVNLVMGAPSPSDITSQQITTLLKITSNTTLYLNGAQTSGSSLTVTPRYMLIKLA